MTTLEHSLVLLRALARAEIRAEGENATVEYTVAGRNPPSGKKRMFGRDGGPTGKVLEEEAWRVWESNKPTTVYFCRCEFNAKEVIKAIDAREAND